MTVSLIKTFTESPTPPRTMAHPRSSIEALWWVVETEDGERGHVLGTSTTRVAVHFPGECKKSCCLPWFDFKEVTTIGPSACACGSGQPFVLCLCDDDPEVIEEAG